MLSSAWAAINSAMRQQSEVITNYLDDAHHDAIVLSHAPNIQAIIARLKKQPDNLHDTEAHKLHLSLAKQFSNLIEEKGYLQIRLIDAQSGMEIVRVDRPDSDMLSPSITPIEALQNKGDRDYVKQGSILHRDEVYISDVSLNREFGKIVIPQQATQRFVVGVFEEYRALEESIDIFQLIAYIRHFDHELSTATIRAVQTGNLSWKEHYNYIAPRLDIALEQAKHFLSDDLHYLIQRITKANIRLIEREEVAFNLVSEGLTNIAESIIIGEEYARFKKDYKQALENLLRALEDKNTSPNNSDEPLALIVINTNFQDVLSSFDALKTYETVLTNSDGNFLYHPEASKQFAFEFNQAAPAIMDEEEELWSQLMSGDKQTPYFDHHDELHVSKKIFFGDDNSGKFLGLILAKQKDVVLQPIYELSTFYAFTSLFAILISLSIILFIISKLIHPIYTLTEQASSIAKGDLKTRLPIIESDDEVGRLTRAFTRLIDKLQNQSRATEAQAIKVETLNDKLEERIAERTAELIEATERANAASNAKTEFLATMSHEIRTPMNGMLGMAQLLANTELNEQQKSHVSTILSSGESLLSIINDILDFSKIEAGKLELEPIPFNLRGVLQETLKLMHLRAKEKGLKLQVSYPAQLHSTFLGDPGRLRQIILNLVGNAIKFTAQGKVEIRVSVEDIDETNSKLCLRVIDTGIGISEEKQAQLFSSFHQADSSTTRKFGGTGLGLAICKKLVALMDGEIQCESQYGEGSVFWFCLSLPRTDDTLTENAKESKEKFSHQEEIRDLPKAKVLLVEDNHINQIVATTLLEGLGLEFELAENGIEAINKWQNGHYNLILMDCLMPEMDGYEATRQIRSLEKENEHITIIAVTANVLPSDQEACKEAGMDDFVAKPLDFNLLHSALQKWLT